MKSKSTKSTRIVEMSLLGKRQWGGYMKKKARAYVGSMPRSGTKYRSYRRFVRRGAPYRSGGFYGASVRSPAERKVIDTANATYAVNTTGSVTLLNGVATGTDFTERIGRRVKCVALQVRGYGGYDTNSAGNSQLIRFLLVEDMQTNGVLAGVTDILQTAHPASFMNMNNRERFRVICDKTFILASLTSAAANCATPSVFKFDIYKKINVPVTFEGTSNTVGSISSGALLAVWVGSTAAGTNDAYANCTFRVRFTDA